VGAPALQSALRESPIAPSDFLTPLLCEWIPPPFHTRPPSTRAPAAQISSRFVPVNTPKISRSPIMKSNSFLNPCGGWCHSPFPLRYNDGKRAPASEARFHCAFE